MEGSPGQKEKRFESGYLDGKRYDVDQLYKFAEGIPIEELPIEQFSSVISLENESEYLSDGKRIRPHEIVERWEELQSDPVWSGLVNHIANVIDLERPVLLSHAGHVIDGQRRIIRSFIEGRTSVKAKRLPENLPKSLEAK